MTIPHPAKTATTNDPTVSRIALVTNAIREVHGLK